MMTMRLARSSLARRAAMFALAGVVPATTSAQQSATTVASLVFDRVTVIDVEQGELIADQRVVIVGNRIHAVGSSHAVSIPQGAKVVDAEGKYLIPGLWDMHTHLALADKYQDEVPVSLNYQLLLANGVTGLRDAGSPQIPVETFRQWRREILAGTRIGPPRQLFSGTKIDEEREDCRRSQTIHCVADSADARRFVDSLASTGIDMLKMYRLSPEMYFVIAAEARRVKLPFGGHISHPPEASEASDSGARILDHLGSLPKLCWEFQDSSVANLDRCRLIAEQFRRNDTWLVPTLVAGPTLTVLMGGAPRPHTSAGRLHQFAIDFWTDSVFRRDWLRKPTVPAASGMQTAVDLRMAERVGMPFLTGTDLTGALKGKPILSGFSLHAELAMLVNSGLSPWRALQAASLNPAKMLHAADSLGTVAAGKLADLVVLDANPLADITNTTMIHAVVANGRYFDRAALDRLLIEVRMTGGEEP